MELVFEKGSPDEPRGHTLVYFRRRTGEGLLATYVVVLPVSMDISKYIPPLLAPQFAGMTPRQMSAFALPPAPEEVSSYEELIRLAELRHDDLVFGGTLFSTDATHLIEAANEAVQRYAQLWTDYLERAPAPAEVEEGGMAVSEVLYSLMSERDKLTEMAKLVGKLRFAVEGQDSALIEETKEEIRLLAKYLPKEYEVERLLEAAQQPRPKGGELARLYLERCYRLSDGREEEARELEKQIKVLESSE